MKVLTMENQGIGGGGGGGGAYTHECVENGSNGKSQF